MALLALAIGKVPTSLFAQEVRVTCADCDAWRQKEPTQLDKDAQDKARVEGLRLLLQQLLLDGIRTTPPPEPTAQNDVEERTAGELSDMLDDQDPTDPTAKLQTPSFPTARAIPQEFIDWIRNDAEAYWKKYEGHAEKYKNALTYRDMTRRILAQADKYNKWVEKYQKVTGAVGTGIQPVTTLSERLNYARSWLAGSDPMFTSLFSDLGDALQQRREHIKNASIPTDIDHAKYALTVEQAKAAQANGTLAAVLDDYRAAFDISIAEGMSEIMAIDEDLVLVQTTSRALVPLQTAVSDAAQSPVDGVFHQFFAYMHLDMDVLNRRIGDVRDELRDRRRKIVDGIEQNRKLRQSLDVNIHLLTQPR